jgi:probable HAF family extracellular repeat protein
MRPRNLAFSITVTVLLALAASPLLAAQEGRAMHHRYKLIDMGTFGGPTSAIYALTGPLNNRGVAASCADTSNSDPNYPNINPFFGSDPYVQHAFRWKKGRLQDLGTLPGGTSSCSQWVNDRGLIVGASTNGQIDPLLGVPEIRAALWKGGSVFDLGTLGGTESVGYGVTEHGEIVGGALNTISDPYTSGFFNFFISGATQVHAFLVKRDGIMHDLGTLGTGTDSMAFYVNNEGQVAGQSFTDTTVNASTGLPTMHPFLWENGKMKDLGTIGGALVTQIAGLNANGQVAGAMNVPGDASDHPFLWDGQSIRDLGTLGGSFGQAWGLNDAGEVVGHAFTQGDQTHDAFLWRDGVMMDLNTLQGDTKSLALVVNASGQIVGWSADLQGNTHVFLWENNGPMVNLQSLVISGPTLSLMPDVFINDRGEITSNALTPDGNNHAVVLIPCDENHLGIEGCDYALVDGSAAADWGGQVQSRSTTKNRNPPNASQDWLQGWRFNRHPAPRRWE